MCTINSFRDIRTYSRLNQQSTRMLKSLNVENERLINEKSDIFQELYPILVTEFFILGSEENFDCNFKTDRDGSDFVEDRLSELSRDQGEGSLCEI